MKTPSKFLDFIFRYAGPFSAILLGFASFGSALYAIFKPADIVPSLLYLRHLQVSLISLWVLGILTLIISQSNRFFPLLYVDSRVYYAITDGLKSICRNLKSELGPDFYAILQFPSKGKCKQLSTRFVSWHAKTEDDVLIQRTKYQVFELPPGIALHANKVIWANYEDHDGQDRWLVSKFEKRKADGIGNIISVPITADENKDGVFDENDVMFAVATFFTKTRKETNGYNICRVINRERAKSKKSGQKPVQDLLNGIGQVIIDILYKQEVLKKRKE